MSGIWAVHEINTENLGIIMIMNISEERLITLLFTKLIIVIVNIVSMAGFKVMLETILWAYL